MRIGGESRCRGLPFHTVSSPVMQMDNEQHLAYFNRAIVRADKADTLAKFNEALQDYDRAIHLEPVPPFFCVLHRVSIPTH